MTAGARPRLAGVAFAAAVLGVGGFALGPHDALVLLAAPTTFAMPIVASIAEWRAGASGRRLDAIAVNLFAIAALAIALTLAAQAVVGHAAFGGLLSHGSRHGSIPTYPYLIPIGATAYIAFLQLSVVSEGRVWLPARYGRAAAPLAVLGCWALAVVAYLLLANWDLVPAATRAAIGLRPVTGPLPALDIVAVLVAITGWQAAFNLLDGWPLSRLRRTPVRIAASNLAIVALGTATYAVARLALGVSSVELEAAAAMFAAGASVMTGPLRGWPLAGLPPAVRRWWMAGAAVVLAAAGDVGLRAVALAVDDSWTTLGGVQLWLVVSGLNLVGGGVLIAGPILGLQPTAAPVGHPEEQVAA